MQSWQVLPNKKVSIHRRAVVRAAQQDELSAVVNGRC